MISDERVSWISMVFRVRGSVVLKVLPRIVATTSTAILFTYLQRWEAFHFSLTMSPFLITGLPLGIILGFRNSSSYERFWDGRKLWGSLVNGSRSLLRQLEGFVVARGPDDDDVNAFRKEVTYRLIGFVHALKLHLRGERDLTELAPFVDPSELDALATEPSPPAALLHRLGGDLRVAGERGWLVERHAPVLEATLVSLTDVVGGCERIKNTPTPMSYLVFIHRAVAFYCFILPFGVQDTVHALTPVVVFFVSYALFSLDAIGDELDDPFRTSPNALPIATIARSIEIYARRRLGETDLPAPLSPRDGVLL